MRGARVLVLVALVGVMGSFPARSVPPGFLKLSFCTGDGYLQIFDHGPIGDDISLNGDIGCIREPGGRAFPMHVEAIIGASGVGTAGACGPDGVEAPLTKLRLRVTMTLTLGAKTFTAIRTWVGQSDGDFPGTNINGYVRDPAGVVNLGRFRLEPFASFYCAHDFSYIRLWDAVLGPAPGA